jgi:enterochelin esterase-like enzyme
MKIIIKIIFFNLIISSSIAAYIPEPIPGTKMDCAKEEGTSPWSYCITKVPGSLSKEVIYHFHGRNGDATWWNDKSYHTGKVHQEWLKTGKEVPTVISISFGKLWMLTRTKKETDLIDFFVNKVMPKVESKLSFQPRSRKLIGISMGAVNSIFASLHHPKLFTGAAILCSPLPNVSHHDNFSTLYDYFKSTSISIKRTGFKYYFSWKFFKTKEVWSLNNPVTILKNKKFDFLPEFYITCGKKDDWDCMDGSEAFAKSLKDNGHKVDWRPREGGHCDIDYPSLASFLVP